MHYILSCLHLLLYNRCSNILKHRPFSIIGANKHFYFHLFAKSDISVFQWRVYKYHNSLQIKISRNKLTKTIFISLPEFIMSTYFNKFLTAISECSELHASTARQTVVVCSIQSHFLQVFIEYFYKGRPLTLLPIRDLYSRT